MTGFARREDALGAWSWAVETRSVNGRNLEVRFRGPPGFDGLERAAREAAQARFSRGQVNVNLQARAGDGAREVTVNLAGLERYLDLCAPFVASGRAAAPEMAGLLALPGVIQAAGEADDPVARAALEAAMAASIAVALDDLKVARLEEGRALARLLAGFIERLDVLTDEARVHADAQPAALQARFAKRMGELAGDAVDAERIVQEAAVLALKADVREELDRLVNHIAAARALIDQDGASGRRLDFLIQEFMREANTLCAKSAAAPLTTLGLEMKATIDQFREQAQNVE
jgi:uncharacterized protein (TIGR00255 family)